MILLIVGYIFNHSVFIILFIVLSQVYNLGRLLFPDSLIYGDPINYIFNILYTDIGKQYTLFHYIYNK